MNSQTIAVQASAAQTVSGASGVLSSNLLSSTSADQNVLNVTANVTAVSGTSPSMTLAVQWSDDGGTTWYDADPVDGFTAITAVSKKVKQFTIKANAFRVAWTITGTTPSFTFSLNVSAA